MNNVVSEKMEQVQKKEALWKDAKISFLFQNSPKLMMRENITTI